MAKKKPFQFGREIWSEVLVILLQLYLLFQKSTQSKFCPSETYHRFSNLTKTIGTKNIHYTTISIFCFLSKHIGTICFYEIWPWVTAEDSRIKVMTLVAPILHKSRCMRHSIHYWQFHFRVASFLFYLAV